MSGHVRALFVIHIVLTVVTVEEAVCQFQSQEMAGGFKVTEKVVAFAADKDALQASKEHRTRPTTLVAHTREGLEWKYMIVGRRRRVPNKTPNLPATSLRRDASAKAGVDVADRVSAMVPKVHSKVGACFLHHYRTANHQTIFKFKKGICPWNRANKI